MDLNPFVMQLQQVLGLSLPYCLTLIRTHHHSIVLIADHVTLNDHFHHHRHLLVEEEVLYLKPITVTIKLTVNCTFWCLLRHTPRLPPYRPHHRPLSPCAVIAIIATFVVAFITLISLHRHDLCQGCYQSRPYQMQVSYHRNSSYLFFRNFSSFKLMEPFTLLCENFALNLTLVIAIMLIYVSHVWFELHHLLVVFNFCHHYLNSLLTHPSISQLGHLLPYFPSWVKFLAPIEVSWCNVQGYQRLFLYLRYDSSHISKFENLIGLLELGCSQPFRLH